MKDHPDDLWKEIFIILMWSNFLNLFYYYCFKCIIFTQEMCGENLAENILDSLKITCKTLSKVIWEVKLIMIYGDLM